VELYRTSPGVDRPNILRVLGWIGSRGQGCAGLLESALGDEDPEIRRAALVASWSALPVPALRAANDRSLRDADPRVRSLAVQLLSDQRRAWTKVAFDSTEVADRLLTIAGDTSATVRYGAIGALPHGRVRSADTRATLWRAMDDPDPETRRVALSGLGEVRPRDEAIQKRLIAALGDSALAPTAASALDHAAFLADETLAGLALAVRTGDERLASHALQSILRLAKENPAACDTMAALWEAAPRRLRRDIPDYLLMSGCEPDLAASVIRKALRDGEEDTRRIAVVMIGRLLPDHEAVAVELCLEVLKDPDPRVRLGAIGRLGSVQGSAGLSAIPSLESVAVADTVERVRSAARDAAARLRMER
jgi:hypothetical protein